MDIVWPAATAAGVAVALPAIWLTAKFAFKKRLQKHRGGWFSNCGPPKNSPAHPSTN